VVDHLLPSSELSLKSSVSVSNGCPGLGLGDTDGEIEGDTDADGETDTDGETDADGETDTDGETEGETDGDTEGDAEAEGEFGSGARAITACA
jgi:hypothetical protein